MNCERCTAFGIFRDWRLLCQLYSHATSRTMNNPNSYGTPPSPNSPSEGPALELALGLEDATVSISNEAPVLPQASYDTALASPMSGGSFIHDQADHRLFTSRSVEPKVSEAPAQKVEDEGDSGECHYILHVSSEM